MENNASLESVKRISILVPTYNEEENVVPLTEAIVAEFAQSLPQYDYDITFIDNCSTDTTREKLEEICAANKKVKAIFNARNFGQFNSPYYGICQTTGDCTIVMCADFQDPIEMIPKLVAEWEQGYKVVCAVKETSKENKVMRFLRTCYYKIIRKMSTVEQIEHFTGFGLYDCSFVKVMRELDDPNPFLRGVVAELGYHKKLLPYEQAARRAGKTHNNFKTLYDAAMQSFTTYTKTPIRMLTATGAVTMAGSCVMGTVALVLSFVSAKNVSYKELQHRLTALAAVGFFGSLNLLATSLVGEYLLTLRARVNKRPLVIEERRINFDMAERP
ncbi:MAG: glycosyltransferase family 2 protein [Ruminococcaceae bacterium]|nr:glycosyltransferase family 2 protein [Oscillospiraceae bacterium]